MTPVLQVPKVTKKMADILRGRYHISGPDVPESPEETISKVGERIARNIEWTEDRYEGSLPHLAERSKKWYEGAHAISGRHAKMFGVPHQSAAAVMAILSPQKDWYRNVSLGERVMKIYKEHQNTGWTPEMEAKASKVFEQENEEHQDILKEIRGKALGQLTDPIHKGAWIRTYDEAHHPPRYREITPEGDFGDFIRTKKGEGNITWQGFETIGKAVTAFESGGDMDIIDSALGEQHKVRSFYNNIIQPNAPRITTRRDPDTTDVTVDTHAIGIGLGRPDVTSTPSEKETDPLFKADVASGGMGGTPTSVVTGTKGLYPLYADAYRKVAHQRGLQPRELQSRTWDTRRADTPPKSKREALREPWKRFKAGEMPHEEVLKTIGEILGKPKVPQWAGAKIGQHQSTFMESKINPKMNSFIQFMTESNNPFDINQFMGSVVSGTKIGNKVSGSSPKETEHKEGSLGQFAATAQIISDRLYDSGHTTLNPEQHEQIRKHVFDTLHAHFHPVTGQHRKNDFEFTIKTPEGNPRWSVTVSNPNRADKGPIGVKRDDIVIKSLDTNKPHEEYIDVKTDRANLADRTVSGIFGGRAVHKDPRTSRFLQAIGMLVTPGGTKRVEASPELKRAILRRAERAKKSKGTTAFALVDINTTAPHNSKIGFYKTSGDKQDKALSDIADLDSELLIRSGNPTKSGKISQRVQLQLLRGSVKEVLSKQTTGRHTLSSLMQSKK